MFILLGRINFFIILNLSWQKIVKIKTITTFVVSVVNLLHL